MPSVPSPTPAIPTDASPSAAAAASAGTLAIRRSARVLTLVAAAVIATSAACGGGGGSATPAAGDASNQPQAGTGSSQVKSVMAISQTRDNTLVVDANGVLWARGSNVGGALGIASGTADVLNLISKDAGDGAPVPRAFVRISSSETHSLALTADGVLWGWGDSAEGQLGTEQTMHHKPVQLATDVVAIATAANHSLYVTRSGELFAMGSNSYGQLGTGDKVGRTRAELIGSGFSKVATGLRFSAAVKQDGTLWTWGNSERGELGNGESGRSVSVLTPTQIGSGFSDVFAAGERAFAVRRTGNQLVGWGDNLFGQLGIGEKGGIVPSPRLIGDDYATVTAGAGHTIGRLVDGSLRGWGNNERDQLGIGKASAEALTPTPIPGAYDFVSAGGGNTLFATASGQLKARGFGFPNDTIDFPYDPAAGRENTDPSSGAGGSGSAGGTGGSSGSGGSGGASASGGGGSSQDALNYPEIRYTYQCQPVGGVALGGTLPVNNGPCLAQHKAYATAMACNEVGSDYSFKHVGTPYYQCLVSNSSGSYKSAYEKYLTYFSK